jgi:surface antigen
VLVFTGISGFWVYKKFYRNSQLGLNIKSIFSNPQIIGQKIDSLNGVYVYYNGSIGNVSGRNTAPDGYNIGLKYQCVEFVKRYYYQHLHHKMPDASGNAKDFFDATLSDGQKNLKRNLTQFSNPSLSKPKADDLIIMEGSLTNSYGHVAIVSKVTDTEIEIIQQNPGPHAKSRVRIELLNSNNHWMINNDRVLGWLRKE